ncbi:MULTISPECIES: DegT/DnrJ/EryC1/StrS family aminotransferase [Cyanophyceae]|uniref:DegT/DnrJ/EryC1/StrS family aminotransferase n=1 Tax=Cyanophyceae TaxID=3028117 RepID=UPI0016898E09|nr:MULTISPECIES: DegT/DnrJ/EryC1/StrS family aminotransferase [unclassified Phormidium]MBD1915651.1 DegT/DnrJ/EryC1/StrS family aminotransferase [Phormidium sp. FACHB-77]MBD2029285.1 DegT/DnrJ/EryC1/StrS family aminotransferase [Phormidium sp. FACHB-322]MBD2049275.1 DegT/DnrJ/EryC1/StrS family aminotransferase [Leptolyngbya sp. FACHB-60]
MIRLTIPSIEEDDIQAVSDVLRSSYLVQGLQVKTFEEKVADYVGTHYAIAVSSCTAALHLALLALGVQPGDLVVVTAYSWISTANVIELCGASPVFIDIQPDTFNLDPACLAATLKKLMTDSETAKRVKAILPVHTFGQMANMPEILDIANQYNLPVVEDAACALGATLSRKQAGSWGAMSCFSFHPRKAITTGEGGIITTNDATLVRKLKALRNHGMDPESSSIDFIMPGFNYRMTEFQAALGLSQMDKLDRIITKRRNLAANYNRLLQDTSIRPPMVGIDSYPVYQSYVVLLPELLAQSKQLLIQQLRNQGIETTIGTYHMPLTTYFRSQYNYQKGDFPVTDKVFNQSLTLPLCENLAIEECSQVVDRLLGYQA